MSKLFYITFIVCLLSVCGCVKNNTGNLTVVIESDESDSLIVVLSHSKQYLYTNFTDDRICCYEYKKLPLETGGIYVAKSLQSEEINKALNKCTAGGSGGGETKENDVEAMLLGLKYFPEAKSIVLIADNYEKMRDYEFIDKITVRSQDTLLPSINKKHIPTNNPNLNQNIDLSNSTSSFKPDVSSIDLPEIGTPAATKICSLIKS